MKSFVLSALVLGALAASPASAQVPLPALSPKAMVMQTVGITDVTVDYSSPGVRGRKIFGELVPLGKLWRTGANAATKITFSKDVQVANKPVAAGTYAIFTLPAAKSWTVILSKDKDASADDYDEKQDAARFDVKPEKVAKRERMTFLFVNTTETQTRLDLEWDEVRVSIPITVDTAALTLAGINGYVDTSWRPLANAARYLHEKGNDTPRALAMIDASLAIKEAWYNTWVKAQILSKSDTKAAHALARRAFDLGSKDDASFFAKDDVQKALVDWKPKN